MRPDGDPWPTPCPPVGRQVAYHVKTGDAAICSSGMRLPGRRTKEREKTLLPDTSTRALAALPPALCLKRWRQRSHSHTCDAYTVSSSTAVTAFDASHFARTRLPTQQSSQAIHAGNPPSRQLHFSSRAPLALAPADYRRQSIQKNTMIHTLTRAMPSQCVNRWRKRLLLQPSIS